MQTSNTLALSTCHLQCWRLWLGSCLCSFRFSSSCSTLVAASRSFSAFYLLLRFLIYLAACSIASYFYVSITTLLIIVAVTIFVVFQPYKFDEYNRFDVIVMFSMALMYLAFLSTIVAASLDQYWFQTSRIILGAALLFLSMIVLKPIFSFLTSSQKLRPLFMKVKTVLSRGKLAQQDSSTPLLYPAHEEEGR